MLAGGPGWRPDADVSSGKKEQCQLTANTKYTFIEREGGSEMERKADSGKSVVVAGAALTEPCDQSNCSTMWLKLLAFHSTLVFLR